MLVNSSLSSTYAPMVAESKRAGVPLYFAGSVCPKETYPPADPLQFCSSAFGANLDSQGALGLRQGAGQGAGAHRLRRDGHSRSRAPRSTTPRQLSKTMGMTAGRKADHRRRPRPTTRRSPPSSRTPTRTGCTRGRPGCRRCAPSRRCAGSGWNGRYITWAHLNAEEELARIKDGEFYVIGTNALFQDNLPIHAEIRATTQRANLKYPATYLTEGFIAGLVIESVLKTTAWPPTPAKVLAAMNNLKVDLKGLRGGPLEWTTDNHFRTTQHYRVWHWDPAKKRDRPLQDWQAIAVKR